MREMKLLYIITQADGGGAQKYVLALAKHFKGAIAAGYSTPSPALRSDSKSSEAQKLFDDAKNLQLTTYNLQHLRRNIHPWHDLLAMWEIRQLIRITKPDIVHLNSTKAGILGSFAAIGLKVKVIFTAHGFRFLEPLSNASKSFYLALEKTASLYRDFIISVSDADKKAALDNNVIAENKIQTIYNGLEQINFLPQDEARKALGLPLPSSSPLRGEDKGGGKKFVFGTVANFYKTKGLDVLVDATSMLDDEIKNKVLFAIIGDGSHLPLSPFTRGSTPQGGGGDYIKFLGKIPGASKYLKAFDAFILPSRKEGFPYAILEAMQAGLPVIASKVGGIPEALGDAGILVPADDAKALAGEMQNLLADENLRKALSQKSLERSKLFTEEKMLSETEKIYQKLLN